MFVDASAGGENDRAMKYLEQEFGGPFQRDGDNYMDFSTPRHRIPAGTRSAVESSARRVATLWSG